MRRFLFTVVTATILQLPWILSVSAATPLQAQVDSVHAQNPDMPALAVVIVHNGKALDSGAVGLADPDEDLPFTVDTPVRIASVTKTYVAATVLVLLDHASIPVDAPIAGLLPEEFKQPLIAAGYDLDRIRVDHLLTHTAGMPEHPEHWTFKLRAFLFRGHAWTALEQVELMAGMGQPLSAPGDSFRYSDTGYVLLGQIVERLSGKPLHVAVREVLSLNELGLENTWWEMLEAQPDRAEPRAHQYLEGWDIYGISATADLFGGGGLLASTRDMALFYDALFSGEVLHDPRLVDRMLADSPLIKEQAYKRGVAVREMSGYSYYVHSGYWGTAVYHFPALDITIATTVTDTQYTDQIPGIVQALVEEATNRSAGDKVALDSFLMND
jgi:D-alanyl-D-alanine carboxypeptidase